MLAISVDTLVENTHFSLGYSSPRQIGLKAVESAFSDIVAVGANPAFALISITIPKNCARTIGDQIYVGVHHALKRIGATLIGGDTTVGGNSLALSVTALGTYPAKRKPITRSGAKVGDLILVTGDLGESAAGLFALQHGITTYPQIIERHLEPTCRTDLINTISQIANSAIDISDGLSSELHHICKASRVGCLIEHDSIPLSQETRALAATHDRNPYEWAWNGGEDYQILYTVPPHLKQQAHGVVIGSITDTQARLKMRDGAISTFEPEGFDHFGGG
jgi:thiamine-monophosphate kinase